ncbi:hypothetical protein [Hahella sp. HN01]|uniref:hypothetical protein n=1 Tax=Hahella sp. HN01 TaxID=2847262 RepID=UPI001C1E929C|nr:hypothetical protein [Hahella sp. HN01]MBU6956027.1 hypothetical protein [Hahella sp. HN01]
MIDVDFYFNVWEPGRVSDLAKDIEDALSISFGEAHGEDYESKLLSAPIRFQINEGMEDFSDLMFSKYQFVLNTDSKTPLTNTMLVTLMTYALALLFKKGVAKSGMLVFDGQINLQEWNFQSMDEAFESIDEQLMNFAEFINSLQKEIC